MSLVKHNNRVWLNEPSSHFTGSMVCFDGENVINQGKLLPRYTFVEIASCHAKVRIHNDANGDMTAFIEKLHTMRDELTNFIFHLEQEVDLEEVKSNLKAA